MPGAVPTHEGSGPALGATKAAIVHASLPGYPTPMPLRAAYPLLVMPGPAPTTAVLVGWTLGIVEDGAHALMQMMDMTNCWRGVQATYYLFVFAGATHDGTEHDMRCASKSVIAGNDSTKPQCFLADPGQGALKIVSAAGNVLVWQSDHGEAYTFDTVLAALSHADG